MAQRYDPAEDWTLRTYDPWERDAAPAAPARSRLPRWLVIGAALGTSFLFGDFVGLRGAVPTAADAPAAIDATSLAAADVAGAIAPASEER